jgi:DNA polymerase-3 subunit delta'
MILPCSHEECRSSRKRQEDDFSDPSNREDDNDVRDYEMKDTQLASEIASDPYRAPAPGRGDVISALKARGLRQRLGYRPREARHKVTLIFDAERMCPPFVAQPTAANILLKILEEPPQETLFILTATHPRALLPTIVSRCRWVGLTAIFREDIRKTLEKEGECSADANQIAALADGDLRRAYQITSAEKADFDQMREEAYTFLMTVLTGDPAQILSTIDQITTGTHQTERIKQIFIVLLIWLRDALLLRNGCHDRVVNLDRLNHLERLTRQLSTESLCQWTEWLEKGMEQLSRNVHPSLLLLSMVQRMGHT